MHEDDGDVLLYSLGFNSTVIQQKCGVHSSYSMTSATSFQPQTLRCCELLRDPSVCIPRAERNSADLQSSEVVEYTMYQVKQVKQSSSGSVKA